MVPRAGVEPASLGFQSSAITGSAALAYLLDEPSSSGEMDFGGVPEELGSSSGGADRT